MKRNVIALLSLALVAGFAHAAAPAGTGKIGVVNTDRLLQESPQFRAAQQALQSELAPDLSEIQKLEQSLTAKQDKLRKDASTMTEAQRATAERELNEGIIDYQAKQKKVEDKANVRQEEELNKVRRAVIEEVQKYASANGFDLILSAGVLYASGALDVTGPVLEALKLRPGAAAPAAAPAPARPATP